MKLDPDCVRKILLYVEGHTGYGEYADIKDMAASTGYDMGVIMYHVRQCEWSGMLRDVKLYYAGDGGTITDLSPEAHQFLANIREQTNWHRIKEIASKAGSFSLSILASIAHDVIKGKLGI